MTFTTPKITEMPLRTSLTSLSLFSTSSPPPPCPKPSFHILKTPLSSSCSSSSPYPSTIKKQRSNSTSTSTWLTHWAPPPQSSSSSAVDLSSNKTKPTQSNGHHQDHHQNTNTTAFKTKNTRPFNNNNNSKNKNSKSKSENAVERIVLRLRNLGLTPEEEEEDKEEEEEEEGEEVEKEYDTTQNEHEEVVLVEGEVVGFGEEKLSDLLKREWIRPDTILSESDDDDDDDDVALPWEREVERVGGEEGGKGKKRGFVAKAPTLAELTIEDEELRRLRREGMYIRDRITVAKAGITRDVLEKIHDKWRKNELVRLKFHEVLARDMKTAHEITERRTGGLIIWRSGSIMVVYRGSNYEGPPSKSKPAVREGDALFVPDLSLAANEASSSPDSIKPVIARIDRSENMTEEEAEYNKFLDGLGPRFEEWWGTGVLPVDADLLPPKVPGYKTPFRLLPNGMRSRLTNAEMTNMRKLAKSLPCHFALGRNRNHQGLAVAILKLWEKSLIAKIAVKRGIQNTNNKLMAEEIKALTGGVLLLRNKYFIVIYRGKDFLPTSVATTLSERQELTKQIQDNEEKVRRTVETSPVVVRASSSGEEEGKALAGTLAEFYEAKAQWGREVSTEEREKMIEEAAKAQRTRLVKRIEHKLALAQAKKLRAERLLSKIEASMIHSGPDYDQETITDEERAMFRRVGLRMKAYLPLGVRGVFDGVIENMHLHWKHRELVKLISKQKTIAFVEETARLLEYESGGILVAVERVPKGFAIIYYRGKNYRRPISIRPRNLLTKAKALKRSVAMQRHEALSQHISELENTIQQMKKEIGLPLEEDGDENWDLETYDDLKLVSEFTQSEDEASNDETDWEDEDDGEDNDGIDSEADADFESANFEKDDHVSRASLKVN